MVEKQTQFIPTRKTLLSRLKDLEDQDSWREFFNTYWKFIYGVARRAGLPDAEAQDVVQETVLAVTRNIGGFQYDRGVCSFKSWLMQVIRSRISNQFRKDKQHRSGKVVAPEQTSGTDLLEQLPDPQGNGLEMLWEEEWRKNLMDAAINRVKGKVSAEQFQIFDFAVLKQWPAGKVAQTLKVSLGQVYLARHRVGKLVRKEIAYLEVKTV